MEKCFYSSHNSKERRASIQRPDGKKYNVNFPKNEKNDKNLLDWIKPMVDALTKIYYDEIEFDLTNNIKRERSVWIDGLTFLYDYKDGIVEIYDIKSNSYSIYSPLTTTKIIDVIVGIPELTKFKIKQEIERCQLKTGNIIVKDIILVEYKNTTKYVEIKDFDRYIRKEKLKKIKNDEK